MCNKVPDWRKTGTQHSKTGVVGYSAGARKELEALPEAGHAAGSSNDWELTGQFLLAVMESLALHGSERSAVTCQPSDKL